MRTSAALAVAICAAVSGSAQAVSNVYAVDLRANPNRLLVFPVNAPANTAISTNAGFDGFAMDFNAEATTLYGVTATTNLFGTIDQVTGNFNSIGAISGAGSAETNWSALSAHPTNGLMYATASGGAGVNRLYTIDVATGSTTLIAPITGSAALYIDMAIDRNGNGYIHDIAADQLLTLNLATGATTVIGPTGQLANFAQGMDFDWETNTLYATVYTGAGSGVFASFNLATGAAQVITSTTSWNAEMEMAVKSPIPEPASFALLAGAGMAVLRRRR